MRNAISIRRLVTIAAGGLVVGVAACTPIKPTPPTHLPDPPPPAEAELTIDPLQTALEDDETQVFTIANIGDQESGALDVDLIGAEVTVSADPCVTGGGVAISAGPCSFVITADACSGAVLGGGASCAVEVQHTEPGDVEAAEGELRVSAVPGGEVTAALSEIV